jgi:hypothetical protein
MKTRVIFATFISVLTISCLTKTQNSDNASTSKTKEIKQSENKLPDSLQVKMNSTNLYIVSDATEADFITAQKEYKTNLIADTLKYSKKDNCLRLPISNNSTTEVSYCDTLLDVPEDPEYRRYRYVGHYSDINYYVVESTLYEDYSCDLININTGKKTTISGVPKLSPSNKYLANIIGMGGFGDTPFGFEIYKINEKTRSISKTKGIEQKVDEFKWYPLDFVWSGDKSLIIKIISPKSKDYTDMNLERTKQAVYKKIDLK